MVVSDEKKFIFIHNPKAAGTSIRSLLLRYDSRNNWYWDYLYLGNVDRVVDRAHMPLADLRGLPDYDKLAEYFVFGFTRNPYDRFYSAFIQHHRSFNLALGDFAAFCKTHLTPVTIRYDHTLAHFCPQHYYFYEGRKRRADFIGRVEGIDEDFRRVCALLAIPVAEVPFENATRKEGGGGRKYAEHFNRELLDMVNRLYERDFDLLDYPMLSHPDDLAQMVISKKDEVEFLANKDHLVSVRKFLMVELYNSQQQMLAVAAERDRAVFAAQVAEAEVARLRDGAN